jgi:ABC-type molybdenum transport system ATPase subunit/photorepair protein PhrA
MKKGGASGASASSSSQAGPKVYITAQQSRFHVDADDAPTTTELFIKDLSIGIGQRELLSHAELHLMEGGRYVLVGRNGGGKSSKFLPTPFVIDF